MIYRWMNKPVMHSFHQTAAIFKVSENHKGSSRSLHRVRTEIPTLTFYAVSQIAVENKTKQIEFFFFAVEKRQKSDENPVEEVQSPQTIPKLPKSINSKH